VRYAIGPPDRPNLNGLLMAVDSNELKLVATDGHRLAIAMRSVDLADISYRKVILPRNTISKLMKLLSYEDEPVAIEFSAGAARFRFRAGVLESKLLSGDFPDYQRIIPRERTNVLRLKRESLVRALQRAASRTSAQSRRVRLALSAQRLAICVDVDHEAAPEELEVEYRGAPLQVAFNVEYLLDVLNALDCVEVEVVLGNANTPAVLTIPGRDDFKCVVMPMVWPSA